MRRICVITGSRAEYGALSSFLKLAQKSTILDIKLVVTGMHLSKEFGSTYKRIEEDGYNITKKVDILLSSDTDVSIVKSTGIAMINFSEIFSELKPDIVFIVGDRFEMFAVAYAAAMLKIPIAHCAGGEVTVGATDEFIRHSITKMSWWHFVATEKYKNRVIQLGEAKERIFNIGALGLDLLSKNFLLSKKDLEKQINFNFGEKNLLITYHPVTQEKYSSGKQFDELLKSLKRFKGVKYIFTSPNSDSGGKIIDEKIDNFVNNNKNQSIKIISMGSKNYLSSLQFVDGVVGNSSSGIVEVPSFKIGTVNIGERQKGRIKSESVIDCIPKSREITNAINLITSESFKDSIKQIKNPYGDGKAAEKIIQILEKTEIPKNLKKYFYDL